MNVEMHGKKIAAVFWPDTEDEKGRCLRACRDCDDLYLSATYHGDRDEFWIVQMKDGAEVARHNPRYVEMIQWDDAFWKPSGMGTALSDPSVI